MRNERLRKLVSIGMLCAVAYTVMAVTRIPISSAEFLKYEPKAVVITIAGFLYGPMTSFAMAAVVALLEMMTVSTSGPIGCVMNILATASFSCTAAAVYKKWQTLRGAMAGLVAGTVALTASMLLWNYFITPFYMGVPRDVVAGMLMTVFLPFNLIKGGLDTAFTILLYKPLVLALRKSGLVPPRPDTGAQKGKMSVGVMLVAVLVLVACVLFVLVQRGVI